MGMGRHGGERDTEPLKLLHGQQDTKQAAAGRTEGRQEALPEKPEQLSRNPEAVEDIVPFMFTF